MRQKGGLVAARLGLGLEVAGREIGRVGLQQQPFPRDLLDELQEMTPAAFVADPAGDSDVEIELEIGVQLFLLAGEAVRHRVLHAVRAQELREARMRIA